MALIRDMQRRMPPQGTPPAMGPQEGLQPREPQQPMEQPQQPQGGDSLSFGEEDPKYLEAQLKVNIANAREYVYSEFGSKQIVKMLQESQDIAEGVGQITYELLVSLIDASDKARTPMSRNIMLDLGATIVNEVLTVAKHSGIFTPADDTEEQQVQYESLLFATKMFVEKPPPGYQVNPQQAQQILQSVQSGQFDEPGGAPQGAQPSSLISKMKGGPNGTDRQVRNERT